MRHLIIAARVVMGLIFLVFGLNGFFNFIPAPALPMAAKNFFNALGQTGYMVPLIFTTQTLVGALLLVNCFVPLALALIAPVIVNIVLFHVFLDPAGYYPAIGVSVLEIFLVWSYRKAFFPMLALRPQKD